MSIRPEYELLPRAEQGRQDDPYALTSLDQDWLHVLQPRLQPSGRDVTDAAIGVKKKKGGKSFDDEIDGRGCFNAKEFEKELRSMHRSELENQLGISWHKVRDIIRRADVNKTGMIEYKDFLETVREYRLTTEQASTLKYLGRAFAYAEEFTCRPPTFFMIVITAVEAAFFIYLSVHLSSAHGLEITMDGPVPYCSVLIYNPRRRWEAWRFFTYMFVHIGISHFIFNMIMQILVGVFLEMEQEGLLGSLRVMTVYFSGVLAGSLGTSLSDPNTYIAGASGGVYALIAAHLATMALNWQDDDAIKIQKVVYKPFTKIVRLTFIILLTLHDVGFAIYIRITSTENRTGFMGHLCGALAGLLVGIFVLENRRVKAWESIVQWVSITVFILFLAFAILWNVWGDTWVPGFYPPSDYRLYDDESGNCRHYELF